MPIYSSLSDAMGEAAEGAFLGELLRQSNNFAERENSSALQWRDFARNEEARIESYQAKLELLKAKENSLLKEINEANVKNSALEAKIEKNQSYIDHALLKNKEISKKLAENVKYGKKIKFRMEQMEKAVRYSSADVASLKAIYEPYKALIEKMDLESHLPIRGQEEAENIWNKFVKGDKLTDNPKIQALIDEAPMPVKTPLVEI